MKKELELLEEIVSLLPKGKTIRFDMNRTNKHWLLNYEYYFVSKELTKERLISSVHHGYNRMYDESPHDYLEHDFTDSIKENWKDKLSVGEIKILAWSEFTVEQDTGLCYIFDDKGNYKGIYCHCMNRVDDFIYVGQSLNQFFDLKLTLSEVKYKRPHDDIFAHKLQLSKNQLLSYDTYLKEYEYKILDAELGFSISMELYKEMIDKIFIPLSEEELKYTNLEFVSNDKSLKFIWHFNDFSQTIELDNQSDYIDTKIFNKMNLILSYLESKREFVPFRDIDFGQEYGVAFLSKRKKEGFGNLFRIELIEKL